MNNTDVKANRDVILTQGFEDGMAGWTIVDGHTNSSIQEYPGYAYEGDYVFAFYYTTNPPQYLVSPELPAFSGDLNISFRYQAYSDYYPESFQVGYSSTTNDPTAFTYGEEITTDEVDEWLEYTGTAPAGTKYIAIKCTSYDAYWFIIDYITLSASGSGGGGGGAGSLDNPYAAGTEPIQLERESILMWSNCLDKDMYLFNPDVSINVLLNSADPSYGVTVTLTNLNEVEEAQYPLADRKSVV
mgnify:CR=1 FL=1